MGRDHGCVVLGSLLAHIEDSAGAAGVVEDRVQVSGEIGADLDRLAGSFPDVSLLLGHHLGFLCVGHGLAPGLVLLAHVEIL